MNQSEEINELVKALSIAQSTMNGAKQDSKNPYFKSDYADLTSVWVACKDSLSKNGLAVMQTMEQKDGQIILVTTLAHGSGQWIKSYLPLMASKMDSQGIGSALTYARRYALASIVGICPQDDDAEASMGLSEKDKKQLLKSLEGEDSLMEQMKKKLNVYDITTINRSDYSNVVEFLKNREIRKKEKNGPEEVA